MNPFYFMKSAEENIYVLVSLEMDPIHIDSDYLDQKITTKVCIYQYHPDE